jgi:NAD(P)-dependent dehydrogenase (short-subunit alcohol dehydrogenase family)
VAEPAGRRTVLVTGGAHGIGAAFVRHFAATGNDVMIIDTDAAAGTELAAATGSRFFRADVTSLADSQAAVAQATAWFGGLDVVCLNAGIPGGTSIGADFDPDRYRLGIQVNLDGVVYGANAALPALRARGGGAIVVTSSLAGVSPSADLYYAAAKHALIGLVRSLAPLVAADNITVNAICPGLINTRLVAPHRDTMAGLGLAIAEPELVATAVQTILAAGGTGQAWQIQAGQPAAPIDFPEIALATGSAR